MKKKLSIVSLLLVALLLAACVSGCGSTGKAGSSDSKEIVIGWLGPQTGNVASTAWPSSTASTCISSS